MNGRRAIPWLVCGLLLLASCAPKADSTIKSQPVLEPSGPAKVEQVEVLQLQTQGDPVRVLLTGTLTDECSRLSDVQVSNSGKDFTVSLDTQRLNGATCSGKAESFERVVPLDATGLASGEYTVTANGVKASFTIAAPPASVAMAAAVAPTPVPTQPPALEAIPATGNDVAASTSPQTTAVQPSSPTDTSSTCENKAAFFSDVTIPDNTVLEPGKAFTKTWRLRNEGTCTWGKDYNFVFVSGDEMGAKNSVPMPDTQPGGLVDISVNMVAPDAYGSYTGNWKIQDPSGKQFGVNSGGIDLIWVKIVSNAAPPAPEPLGSTANCASQTNADYIQTVLSSINAERAARSLGALTIDNRLSAAAQVHSVDMACNNYVDHYGFDGSTWFDRIAAQGYKYATASENIYAGNPSFGGDAAGAMVWWMNSQVHRDAILNPKFTQLGIGFASYSGSQWGGYFTVVFAKPK